MVTAAKTAVSPPAKTPAPGTQIPHNERIVIVIEESLLITAISELGSDIHRQFREAHAGHRPHAGLDPSRASTGVVWCTERAYEHGFLDNPSEWANLGQGAPEVEDDIQGSFQRPKTIEVSIAGREYGPTAGIKPLRKAVADLYNAHHRVGKKSQYTWENVCIVPGGRAGLIRIAAVLNNAYLGFFIPVRNLKPAMWANVTGADGVRTTLPITRC